MLTAPAHTKRPQYFACDFCRLLADNEVAAELGPQAAWLLTTIVMKEDQFRYSRPVTFFNEQLVRILGVGSISSLDRVRARCVEAGWLQYTPGGRRVGPGTYHVTVPVGIESVPTYPVLLRTGDEQSGSKPVDTPLPEDLCSSPVRSKPGANREQSDEQSGSKPVPFLPLPVPVPDPVPEDKKEPPIPPAKPGGKKSKDLPPGFVRFWAQYAHRVAKPKALAAWRKLGPDDALEAIILQGVATYFASKPDWQAPAHPSTWLNQRRWEDQPAAPPAPVRNSPRSDRVTDYAQKTLLDALGVKDS